MGKKKLFFQGSRFSVNWNNFMSLKTMSTSSDFSITINTGGLDVWWKSVINGISQKISKSPTVNIDLSSNTGVAELTGADVSETTSLTIYDKRIKEIDFGVLSKLTYLLLDNRPWGNSNEIIIDITQLPKLKDVEIRYLKPSSNEIDLNSCPELVTFNGYSGYFKYLRIENCTKLTRIEGRYVNNVVLMDVSNKPNLDYIKFDRSPVRGDISYTFDFSTSTNIRYVEISAAEDNFLNVTGCDKLEHLRIRKFKGAVLDLSDCSALTYSGWWESTTDGSVIYPTINNLLTWTIYACHEVYDTDLTTSLNLITLSANLNRNLTNVNINGLIYLKNISIYGKLTSSPYVRTPVEYIDMSTNIALQSISIYTTSLNNIVITNSPNILTFKVYDNDPLITGIDDAIIQLDNNGLSDGIISITASTRTSASDLAIANLIAKGWDITERAYP